MHPIKKILCPVDFLSHSKLVAEHAVAMAKAFGAEIELLYVSPIFTDYGGHQEMDPKELQTVEQALHKGATTAMDKFIAENFSGVTAKSKILSGNPAHEIIQHIKNTNPDMVIMGTQGRTGVGLFFFGSVAEKVVRMSPSPVLTVRT